MTTILLSLMLLLAPVALADDEGDDDRDKGERADVKDRLEREEGEDHEGLWKGGARKMSFEVDDQQAKIKLSRADNGTRDEVSVRYDAEAGKMKIEYKTENATSETETELQVRFREVLEFRDGNGNGAYDLNETLVAKYPIDSLDWRIVGPEPVTTGSGLPGHRITGVGAFPAGGELRFVMYVYGDFANVNGTDIAPTDVKIDIILDRFPYKANDTLPALIVRSEQESDIEVEGGDDDLAAVANGFEARFSWAPNATVDGVDTRVHTTMLRSSSDEDGESRTVALSYARGTYMNHDPVLGVQSAGAAERSVPGVGVVGVLAVAVVAFVALRRGKDP